MLPFNQYIFLFLYVEYLVILYFIMKHCEWYIRIKGRHFILLVQKFSMPYIFKGYNIESFYEEDELLIHIINSEMR